MCLLSPELGCVLEFSVIVCCLCAEHMRQTMVLWALLNGVWWRLVLQQYGHMHMNFRHDDCVLRLQSWFVRCFVQGVVE